MSFGAARKAALLLLLPALTAAAAPEATPDRLVARLRAVDDLAIQTGILAQRRGQTDAVRRYGRVLERDGRLADGKVLGLARRQRLRLGPEAETPEERALLVRLEGVPDAQFDREFLPAVRAAQERAVAELRGARRATADRRLAALLGRVVPVLDQDRQLAAALEKRRPPRARGG